MRAMTSTSVLAIPFIVRLAGGLEACEAPWHRTAFRTRGFSLLDAKERGNLQLTNRMWRLAIVQQRRAIALHHEVHDPSLLGHFGKFHQCFGAARRHRAAPRPGEVHVASSRSCKPLSVHLRECARSRGEAP